MKPLKDPNAKEKLSSKKMFLLETILSNLSSNPKEEKDKPVALFNPHPAEPVKKRDFKIEIENRFRKSGNDKYVFPRLFDEEHQEEGDCSLESIKSLGVYDLNVQNENTKKEVAEPSATKKLMESIQRKKNSEEINKDNFSETLKKMKQSLQEKLRSQMFVNSHKFNNFLDDNGDNPENRSQNASERLEHSKAKNNKNQRTSFSILHSTFNRSLQQNAQTLDHFFKNRGNQVKENAKKMHLLNFLELRKEKQRFLEKNVNLMSPKDLEHKAELGNNSIKQENNTLNYGLMAKKLYRKMQDNIRNNNSQSTRQKELLSFENPGSDLLRKSRNSQKLQNLTDRNKDSLITSNNKLNEVNDFFNKITKKTPNLTRGKSNTQKIIPKKDNAHKTLSKDPSFNSSSSYSSQRFLNTPISLNIKNI